MDEKILIQKLANKYNLPLKEVENIIYHQFKFVSKIMSKGKFESVRLPYFGKFHVKEKRLKYIKEKSGSINNK
jgi:nucleoid DNA-binding protein